ncbi:MAG: SPOR domain-containing protein [Bacteroidota bacterium]|nr:SPOR domain-containing protein [Bacteroidota bacterium]
MMFKQLSKTFVPLAAMLLFLAGAGLYGQQQAVGISDVKEDALASFDRGDYRSALAGFRGLLELDGGDPMYSYYAGRCLVELNESVDEAIELLYSASRHNAPADAVFYLGRAYHLNYNFQDALKYYENFETIASRQERKELQVKHLIGTCRSAIEITSSYNPFELMNVTFLDLSDSLQYSQVKMKGGDLGLKPDVYFNHDEDRKALTSLMFKPKNPVRGDYIYYSGYGKGSKDGAQIFRVRKGSGKSWGDPQEVSYLNSPGNEILPYFDPIENDLYFASDGRYGVGGFDLYKSHFDEERDLWTEAINLGFPVNSVADEYLLLPGSDLGMVLFFSSRQGTDSTVTVYRVHLVEPKKKTNLNDYQQLREIAQLGDVAEEMLAGLETPAQTLPRVQRDAAPMDAAPMEENNPLPVYQETLASALKHQAVSDSLKDLAGSARMKVRESKDPNDRWVWQKQIMVWEKKARDEEEIADQLYAKMEQERSKQRDGHAVNPPETIEVDRVVDGLTVYRYTTTDPGEKAGAGPRAPEHHFEILNESPYNENNPIPMDVALPPGTYYRIQLGAFGFAIDPSTFGGISPLTGENLKEKGLVKYYAGEFSRYEDASTALPRIHSKGFEDAFIVSWYNGNQVSTQKAKQLE